MEKAKQEELARDMYDAVVALRAKWGGNLDCMVIMAIDDCQQMLVHKGGPGHDDEQLAAHVWPWLSRAASKTREEALGLGRGRPMPGTFSKEGKPQ